MGSGSSKTKKASPAATKKSETSVAVVKQEPAAPPTPVIKKDEPTIIPEAAAEPAPVAAPAPRAVASVPQKQPDTQPKAASQSKWAAQKKQKAKWEVFNVDDLMKLLDNVSLAQKWYDVVDSLVSEEQPAVKPNTKRKGWRTVRLFISSTFKDMHSEREHLVKVIIPVLRQWCQERKLNLIECDLRWGVPKDADTRETLLTCLSEIDRCRQENEYPYFLSMLSERYGFVMEPDQVPDDIKARYKWLPGMSVTALEIMTGAYWDNNPNALFMMRKPDFVQRVDEDIRPAYIESSDDANHSLSVLKNKVKRHFPGRVKDYDCIVEGREGNRATLGSLDQFGQVILDHFKARIEEQYPQISGLEELSITEIKRADQEEFMHQRSQVLLGRDDELKKVADYIHSDVKTTGLLTLAGYPGAGKSSLMAHAASHYLEDSSLKVFFHFVGATPDSTSVYSVLSRIYRECMPNDQQDSMPVDADDMMRFTPTMFGEAAREAQSSGFSKLVVFIDALNQMDDVGNTHKLAWLPRQLPAGMRVVVSTLEGQCLDSLRNHAKPAQEVAVNPLSEDIRKCIAEELLLIYNKRLDEEQMDILVKKTDAGRPLFLTIACEELRVFGEFRRLTEKIRTLSDDMSGLVEIVLHRTVEEFGGELVQATLCLIETSRFGLEEEELLHLLSAQPVLPTSPNDCSPSDFKDKMPMAVWGFLYVGLRSFLRPSGSSGDDRLDFYHRSISKVVRRMYLSTRQEADKWHGRLIQFFSACPDLARKAEELPYHYVTMGNIEGLRRCLTARDMFEHLYTESNKQTLMQYWQVVGGYDIAASSYKQALPDYMSLYGLEGTTEGEKLSTKVAWFLVDIGEYETADEMLTGIIRKLKEKYGEEAVELADPLHATMSMLMSKGLKYVYGSHPGYIECVKRGRELVDLTVKVHRKKFPADSNRLGNVLSLCGYFKSSLLDECRAIFTTNNNKVGLAMVLYTLGEKHQYDADMNVPIQLFKEALALCKVYFGNYHLNTARCVQLYGQLFWNRWTTSHRDDWLAESLVHYTAELDILEEILGHDHPTTVRSREDVIIILQSLGREADANEYLAQQPETREGIA